MCAFAFLVGLFTGIVVTLFAVYLVNQRDSDEDLWPDEQHEEATKYDRKD